MTGGGEGFCALRAPREPGEAVQGFAGISGRPVRGFPRNQAGELARLRTLAVQMETALHEIQHRLRCFEGRVGPGCDAVNCGEKQDER